MASFKNKAKVSVLKLIIWFHWPLNSLQVTFRNNKRGPPTDLYEFKDTRANLSCFVRMSRGQCVMPVRRTPVWMWVNTVDYQTAAIS